MEIIETPGGGVQKCPNLADIILRTAPYVPVFVIFWQSLIFHKQRIYSLQKILLELKVHSMDSIHTKILLELSVNTQEKVGHHYRLPFQKY